jgi:Fe-S-cluster containining protein
VTDPLRFRCTACGECCRKLRVAITDRDLLRLLRATGREPRELVDFLEPAAVDMSGEPESFVELREGRRLMVLAHGRDGCQHLDQQSRCSVYADRPADCRAFPFDVERPPGGRRRLVLLPLDGCDYASDGDNVEDEIVSQDARRWEELERYQRRVESWNRAARHRRRLGKLVGGSAEYLEFLRLA